MEIADKIEQRIYQGENWELKVYGSNGKEISMFNIGELQDEIEYMVANGVRDEDDSVEIYLDNDNPLLHDDFILNKIVEYFGGSDVPKSIEELKQDIENGDDVTLWVNFSIKYDENLDETNQQKSRISMIIEEFEKLNEISDEVVDKVVDKRKADAWDAEDKLLNAKSLKHSISNLRGRRYKSSNAKNHLKDIQIRHELEDNYSYKLNKLGYNQELYNKWLKRGKTK